jgi:hypothetical protein
LEGHILKGFSRGNQVSLTKWFFSGKTTPMVALPQINRHKTHAVRVRNVTVGGGAPIVVQAMTNTDTADVEVTYQQVRELWLAGSEIVRVTVNNDEAAIGVAKQIGRASCRERVS